MTAPACICYDLYCGLGGWAEGFLAEGYAVTGFDIEAHDYGTGGYPGTLVLRDVRSIHGSELKDAACIVGSSPCQEFSYRAMPWKRAKALPPPYLGIELFNAQFRIQREACEAAGRYIPMVVENVRGAQKWVGRARWHYGSYYLWGDVPALMPMTLHKKLPGHDRFYDTGIPVGRMTQADYPSKIPGFRFDGSGKSFQSESVAAAQRYREGVKTAQDSEGGYGGNFGWDNTPLRRGNSRSDSRKAASALIAKIPFVLAQHIARSFKP